MGNFNGQEACGAVIGKHGLEERSEGGGRWAHYCITIGQVDVNTWFDNIQDGYAHGKGREVFTRTKSTT